MMRLICKHLIIQLEIFPTTLNDRYQNGVAKCVVLESGYYNDRNKTMISAHDIGNKQDY